MNVSGLIHFGMSKRERLEKKRQTRIVKKQLLAEKRNRPPGTGRLRELTKLPTLESTLRDAQKRVAVLFQLYDGVGRRIENKKPTPQEVARQVKAWRAQLRRLRQELTTEQLAGFMDQVRPEGKGFFEPMLKNEINLNLSPTGLKALRIGLYKYVNRVAAIARSGGELPPAKTYIGKQAHWLHGLLSILGKELDARESNLKQREKPTPDEAKAFKKIETLREGIKYLNAYVNRIAA